MSGDDHFLRPDNDEHPAKKSLRRIFDEEGGILGPAVASERIIFEHIAPFEAEIARILAKLRERKAALGERT